MSNISKRRREGSRAKIKTMGDHKEFLKRITKTLYYGELPTLPCLSMPVTEVSCWAWSVSQRGRSVRRLHGDAAAHIARAACVSPCALVLAVLYLERLRNTNPDYLAYAHPTELFLVSLMVGNKFLQDDGEDDEVICSEWAASGGLELNQLKKLEVEFLDAIDWNVFVSEKSFETGLRWLEKQVALRQSAAHGFFTYTDLAAACDARVCAGLARALAAAAAAAASAALAYALVLCASLGALAPLAALAAAGPGEPRAPLSALPAPADGNSTVSAAEERERLLAAGLRCCARWASLEAPARLLAAPRPLQAWWARGAELRWARGAGALQRWLERLAEYADAAGAAGGCGARLGLCRLGALVVSVSDR